MAQDFGDEFGELLVSGIKRAAERKLEVYFQNRSKQAKDWYKQQAIDAGETTEIAAIEADRLASREQVCLPFATAEDAERFAEVCRENGTYCDSLKDSDGNGYILFAKDDIEKVTANSSKFAEHCLW